MRGLAGAVALLTRLPVRGAGEAADVARSVKWFGVVGLAIGAVTGLTYWAAAGVFGPSLGAIVAVAVTVGVTGAMHEDGLADTFDGLSSTRSRERQFEIMKDSRLGTFGVTALVLVLAARVTLVSQLPGGAGAISVLAWVHGLSRAVVVGVMLGATPATAEGSAAAYRADVKRLPAAAMALAVVGSGWWVVGDRLWPAAAAAGSAAVALGSWSHRRLGGVTGDVLGACQQVALVAALAVVAR